MRQHSQQTNVPESPLGNIVGNICVKKIDPRKIRECADRITRTRLALGFKTQTAFCKEIGVRYDLYNAFERALRRVSLAAAFKIRDKLGIPLDWTYCGDDSRLPAALYKKLQEHK